MGIEPTRAVRPEPENKPFGANANTKCDSRVNFGGTWGYVRLRSDTSVCEVPGSSLLVVGLQSASWGHTAAQSCGPIPAVRRLPVSYRHRIR
jgi:hypothetical protein